MDRHKLISKYLDFFKSKGHAVIKGAPLIPEHNPSVLFTTAGMHPLVPFLLGQPHPQGKRLCDVQKCLRTGDIEDVGDSRHLTFFEMLGNWSLGDYFKKESITWSYEFLTKILNVNLKVINVTVFAGDKDAPRDDESASIWESLGIPEGKIFYLPKEDNFWIQSSGLGPCGPCTEIFIDMGCPKCSPDCRPGCKCSKYLEVWNNVFMEYSKTKEGKYEKLSQKNVDTGMGVERTITILNGKDNVFETDLFAPLLKIVKEKSDDFNERSARIIADHLRAAAFILGDEKGVTPSNTDQGYVLRRLIRRAIRHARILGIGKGLCQEVSGEVIKMYCKDYPLLKEKEKFILDELGQEESKFLNTLEKGLKMFEKLTAGKKEITCSDAFLLFQSYGFPIEVTRELALERGLSIDVKGFEDECQRHQELSRKGAGQKFKGGLADTGEVTTRLHSATHILAEALRQVLDKNIKQKGSNITPERLRFDFNFDRKVTPEELKKVEDLVNKEIKAGLPVKREEMTFEQAKKIGAQAEFEGRYGEKVFVYSMGKFSKEVCGGPHVSNTKELSKFKIIKEEAVAAGIRRIKATLE